VKKKICILAELDSIISERLESEFDIVFRKTKENQKIGTTEESLAELLEKYDPEIAVIEANPFTRGVIGKAKSLKLIASVRTTPSNIDMVAAREAGVVVTNAPGRNAIAVAEFAIALILSCARNIPKAHHALKIGKYLLPDTISPDNNVNDVIWTNKNLERRPYLDFRGHEIMGSTLGIFGLGYIGRLVAQRALALGMKVIAFDPFVSKEDMLAIDCRKVGFDELLLGSDYISLHAKTSEETKGKFDINAFGTMKNTAYLINTARGALVNQGDLVEALKNGLIAGAALDVFESEPLQVGNELLTLDNIIHTPHIGGATADVVRHQSDLVMRNIDAYCKGESLPDAWGKK